MTVSRYREKIVNVEAETFKGWPGVDALFKWSGGQGLLRS